MNKATVACINNGPTFVHMIVTEDGRDGRGHRKFVREVVKRGQIAHLTEEEYARKSEQFSKQFDPSLIIDVHVQAAVRVIEDLNELSHLEACYSAESRNVGRHVSPRKEVLDAIEIKKRELEAAASPSTKKAK